MSIQKVKKKKTTQNSTSPKKRSKKLGRWHETYYSFRSWRQTPIDDQGLEEMGKDLVKFAQKHRADKNSRKLSLEAFFEEIGVSDVTFLKWRKRSPYLEECCQHALRIFGNKIEENAYYKDISERLALLQLHNYLPRWDKTNRYHAELKNDSSDEKGPFNVHMSDADSLGSITEDLVK